MKPILVLHFVLTLVCLYAQDTHEYYSKINEGKTFAIQKDFQSAINLYQQAFESCGFSFARDCYNAIELSVIVDDTIHLRYFLKKAIIQGIRIEDLEKSGRINNYLNTYFYKKIKNQEDSLRHIYSSRINWELRTEINQMFFEDQKMRELYYSSNIFKRKKIEKEWEELNAKQAERLVQITKEIGFPGERLIGLDRNDMHPKIMTNNYSAGMPIVILIHHFSQPNKSYSKLLIEEVEKGNLYNEHFATICDFEAEFGKKNHESIGYYGLRHQPRKTDIKTMNRRRKKIGILDIEKINQLNQVKNLTKFWNRLY